MLSDCVSISNFNNISLLYIIYKPNTIRKITDSLIETDKSVNMRFFENKIVPCAQQVAHFRVSNTHYFSKMLARGAV